eukprot:292291_1
MEPKYHSQTDKGVTLIAHNVCPPIDDNDRCFVMSLCALSIHDGYGISRQTHLAVPHPIKFNCNVRLHPNHLSHCEIIMELIKSRTKYYFTIFPFFNFSRF